MFNCSHSPGCWANVAEVNELMRILHTYETASGQEVNLVKSEVFISRNMSQAAKEDLSRILGVKLVLGSYESSYDSDLTILNQPTDPTNESSDIVGRVAMLLWCIWHNRNDKLWNDNVQMPRQIGRHAFDAWNDWYSVHKLQSNDVSGTTEADLVRSEKPTLDWVKCNVDVAFVSGSGRTSVGFCFRDNSGHFMAGMTQ
ncbi:hypothetical protein TSUD_250330 [Trifolium subterraneum]|nr:hypothetical protein TSUD_250330 [Trifolium subterraneum]